MKVSEALKDESGARKHLRGFGMTLDFTTGSMRNWVVGADGIKRLADTMKPVESLTREGAK